MDFGEDGADALATELKRLAERIGGEHPEYTAAAEAFIQRLKSAHAGASAPAIGQEMPAFVLPDAGGELVSLNTFAGRPLALLLMRGHWCDFCQAQADALASAAAKIQDMNAVVAIITPERPRFAKPLIEGAREFRLLCDLDNGYAATLGLLAPIDDALAAHLARFGIDAPAYQGALGWAVPIPATFVLSASGRIFDRAFDPDYRRRPSIQSLIDAVARAAAAP